MELRITNSNTWYTGEIWDQGKWRPAEDVQGSKQLVSEFHCSNPETPQHISALDFTISPSAQSPTSLTLPTQPHQTGLQGIAHLDATHLRGRVNVRVFPF